MRSQKKIGGECCVDESLAGENIQKKHYLHNKFHKLALWKVQAASGAPS